MKEKECKYFCSYALRRDERRGCLRCVKKRVRVSTFASLYFHARRSVVIAARHRLISVPWMELKFHALSHTRDESCWRENWNFLMTTKSTYHLMHIIFYSNNNITINSILVMLPSSSTYHHQQSTVIRSAGNVIWTVWTWSSARCVTCCLAAVQEFSQLLMLCFPDFLDPFSSLFGSLLVSSGGFVWAKDKHLWGIFRGSLTIVCLRLLSAQKTRAAQSKYDDECTTCHAKRRRDRENLILQDFTWPEQRELKKKTMMKWKKSRPTTRWWWWWFQCKITDMQRKRSSKKFDCCIPGSLWGEWWASKRKQSIRSKGALHEDEERKKLE